jgi:hypothetical protein
LITLHDLEEAIAECQGERNPNANTCIKLAAFYTIRNEMFGESHEAPESPTTHDEVMPSMRFAPTYSGDTEPQRTAQAEKTIDYNSGTEFADAIDGMDASEVWPIIDELMSVIQATNIRLYNGVMRKIDQL